MSFPKLHVSPVPGDVQHVTGPLRVLDVSLLQREPLVLWPLSVLSRHGSYRPRVVDGEDVATSVP